MAICDEVTIVNIPPQQTISQSESMKAHALWKSLHNRLNASVVGILPSSSPESGALRESNGVG